MVYPIVIYGHPVLRKVAVDIDRSYPDLDQLITDLFETLYRSEGLGLAAPQIGKSIRMFVIDGEPLAEDEPEMAGFKKVFINARIIERSGDLELMAEGCLSIPNLREEVKREGHIRITYYDERWEFHDEVYQGYLARVIQHEYDHIEGVLFTDHLSSLKKKLVKGKLMKISQGDVSVNYKMRFPK